MKKTLRIIGLIAILALVGFSFMACDDGSQQLRSNGLSGNNGGGNSGAGGAVVNLNPLLGIWLHEDGNNVLVFNEDFTYAHYLQISNYFIENHTKIGTFDYKKYNEIKSSIEDNINYIFSNGGSDKTTSSFTSSSTWFIHNPGNFDENSGEFIPDGGHYYANYTINSKKDKFNVVYGFATTNNYLWSQFWGVWSKITEEELEELL